MGQQDLRLSRRRLLGAAGALSLVAAAPPSLRRGLFAPGDVDAGTGFSLGVASFDPTPDGIVLWTRVDDLRRTAGVRYRLVAADGPVVPSALQGLEPVATGRTIHLGDGCLRADVDGQLEPGRHYWYQFDGGGRYSAVGRTKTATLGGSLRLAVTSCQDLQQGWYTVWEDVAAQDLDAVVFLGDYIYEYAAYVGDPGRTYPRVHLTADGQPAGETYTLADYRQRYRQYRADPQLRLAHRLHPWVAVWDDHEVAGDRWATGAVNHGDDAGEELIAYADRERAGITAYHEYLPARGVATAGGINRSLRFGDLAELVMLDSRTFRSAGVGGTNRNFNPSSNIDEPGISADGRTILGPDQKAWFKDTIAGAGPRWKLIGNQLMMAPLNLASLPDLLGQHVARLTQNEGEPLPVTYHRDGIPVNTDQWDGYQVERRELLQFLRGDHTGQRIEDVVFLTGDIHTGWCSEVLVEQGDAPVGDPVAAEFVCPGISSENFNERLGMLSIGRPFPHGSTNPVGVAAISINRHVRYVDFDANGYVLLDVDDERVVGQQRVLGMPLGSPPDANPIEHRDAVVTDAIAGRLQVVRGSSRLLPAAPG